MTEQNQQNKPLSWTAPTTPNNKPSNDSNSKNTAKKSSEQRSTATVFAISAGVTILLLAIACWLFLRGGQKAPAEAVTSTPDVSDTVPAVVGDTKTDTSVVPSTVTTTTSASSNIVTLGETETAGTSVALSSVDITAPTWVIVYESRNGTPGNILGAALFLTSQKDGSVELLRGTSAGATYFVAAALDNGDRSFSMKDDQPIKDTNGNPQLLTFVAK